MISLLPARGPTPIFPHLLPSLVLAVFATLLFWWNPFGRPPETAYFDALLKSDIAGTAEFISDIDNAGLSKERALTAPVLAGQVTHLRFPMSAGQLRAFIFTPLLENRQIDLVRCWLTAESGEVIAAVSPVALQRSNPQMLELRAEGVVRFHPRADQVVAGVQFKPEKPIDVAIEPPPPAWQLMAVFVLTLAGCVGASLAVGDRVAAASWLHRSVDWVRVNSVKALLCAALVSVTICCFPVIFCGKSFISPDNGMALLYGDNPTVPGAQGGRVENAMGSDMGATMYWHLPSSMIAHRALFQDGEFPLWNRYNWSGLTFFGQNLAMLGDPLHWPAILTGGAAWSWDLKFVLAQVLFAFGVGLLVWRSSGSQPAALLLTLSAPFMGFFAYRFCHAAFFSLCYAPWILVAWVEGLHAATLRRAVLWSGFLIFANWWQLNSGTAKEASAFLVFLNLAGGCMLVLAAQPWRWRVQRLAVFAWANVLFVLLSAPFWVIFLDALGKAYTIYTQPRIYQMQPGLALGLFDDIFHRQFMGVEFLFNPSTNFFVLLGTAWALVRIRSLARERVLVAVAIPAVIAAALAFGVVAPSIAAAIPFVKNIFHFDNTFSCVLFILLFVIAGFGLRECLARMRSVEWRGDWMLVLALVGVLLGAYLGLTQAAHRVGRTFLAVGETVPKSAFFGQYVTGLVVALALLPWAWRQAVLRRPAAMLWAMVALAAFATLHFRHGMYLVTKFDLYTRNPKARMDLRHVTSPALETVRERAAEPSRVVGLDSTLISGFNAALGLETISGPDALMNPEMIDFVALLGIERIWGWRLMVHREDFPRVHRALDLLNVRYFLDKPQAEPLSGTKALGSSDMTVVESETAWPRAFFTDTVGVYSSGTQLKRIVEEGDGRPFAVVTPAQRTTVPLPPREYASRVVQRATNYRLTNNTTSFEIDAPTPGVAVLMEANMPGDIQAFVDGQPASFLVVNHVFRGVLIEKPGRHVVKFAYWPTLLGPALGIGAFGLVGLLLSAWVWWRTRVPTTGTVPAEMEAPQFLTTSP